MSQHSNNMAAYIWSLADLLRGDFKQSKFGRIILPFTLLRRLECVLESTKAQVLTQYESLQNSSMSEEVIAKMLLRATGGLSFFNTSKLDLSNLGHAGIKDNLEAYIQAFSKDAREIFEHFNFMDFVVNLDEANLLYKVVQRVRTVDLSPESVSNHDMGLIFEELIRRFAESSNDTAGEHFTPRDIVRLTTSLTFMTDQHIMGSGVIRTIYDPTAGTGGFLSSGMEYVHELNADAAIRAFGQELNPESYAICKADMMVKGQDVSQIKLGNTLSDDQLSGKHFDYMLSNPPFGVDWKKIAEHVSAEHREKGFGGRFGPGLPRVSDGSLLFLLHLISKLKPLNKDGEGGGRIGIILNGSPLFTGSAGSGESEIRRYILESDLLETIVALPTDMFYNTGIATYIWILSNHKTQERKGKVQLIDASALSQKMRKSLGSKRNEISDAQQADIIRCFGNFEASKDPQSGLASKIFATTDFGYRRVTIERPLRESYAFSDERLNTLRFDPKTLQAVMQWIYETYGDTWSDAPDCPHYGQLADHEADIRIKIKADFSELKEKQIKQLFDRDIWLGYKDQLLAARSLQSVMGKAPINDNAQYQKELKAAQKQLGLSLDKKTLQAINQAVSFKNPEAEKVIKKVHKTAPNPLYGLFEVNGKTVEYATDSELRDYENIPLDPQQSTSDLVEGYVQREVLPHVPDAWIDAKKTDAQDGEVGIVGYEIPFNRHFYEYTPPRSLEAIDADLDKVSREIMELLQAVHS